MNTTKNIHLSHIKFTLDEEAYIILNSYLKNLSIAFSSNSSKDEILNDIESHIAELFSKYNDSDRVITILQVNEAITALGSPEELSIEEVESDNSNKLSKKKFFRDIENSYFGGVASGLSHYFGISPSWMRIIFILLFFSPIPPGTILIYCIMWIVVPSAKTNADKIRMNGGVVSLNSIKNKVESLAPKVESHINDLDNNGKDFFEKLKYYLRKTSKYLIVNIAKLLNIASIIFGYVLMFYSFLSGVVVAIVMFVSSNIRTAISESTYSELIIEGSTIYNINNYLRFDVLDFISSITSLSIIIFGLLIIIPTAILFIIGLKLAFRSSIKVSKLILYTLSAIWIIACIYFVYIIGIEFVSENFPYNL